MIHLGPVLTVPSAPISPDSHLGAPALPRCCDNRSKRDGVTDIGDSQCSFVMDPFEIGKSDKRARRVCVWSRENQSERSVWISSCGWRELGPYRMNSEQRPMVSAYPVLGYSPSGQYGEGARLFARPSLFKLRLHALGRLTLQVLELTCAQPLPAFLTRIIVLFRNIPRSRCDRLPYPSHLARRTVSLATCRIILVTNPAVENAKVPVHGTDAGFCAPSGWKGGQ